VVDSCEHGISRISKALFLLLLLFILTANGFSPGGSGTTIRYKTQIAYISQYNITIKRNTAHKSRHTINTLHRIEIQQSQLQLYKAVMLIDGGPLHLNTLEG
jgi:hypothetical protein